MADQFRSDVNSLVKLLKGAYQGATNYAAEAQADPANQIGIAGPVGNRFLREMGVGTVKQLWDDKLGYEPFMRGVQNTDISALTRALQGKTTGLEALNTINKTGDAALNYGQAALDVATVAPLVKPAIGAGRSAVRAMSAQAEEAPAIVKALQGVDDVKPFKPDVFEYPDGVVDFRFPMPSGDPATMSGRLADGRLSVDYMQVPEAFQRQGYGTRMHESLMDWAKQKGVSAIDSDSVLSPGAVKLYESMKAKGLPVQQGAAQRMAPDGSAVADGPVYSFSINAPEGPTLYRGMRNPERIDNPGRVRWYSEDPEIANRYAMNGADSINQMEPGKFPFVERSQPSLGKSLEVDAAGSDFSKIKPKDPQSLPFQWFGGNSDSLAQKAKLAGYDSVIFRNLRDDGGYGGGQPSTVYALLSQPEKNTAANPTTLGMGFPFGDKPGQKSVFDSVRDMLRGKDTPKGFTPPKTLDDIYTGGQPRGPREITGGAENPAGMESSYFHDPRFTGAPEVPYTEGQGFGGLDQRLGQLPENPIVKALMAKRAKPDDNELLNLLMAYGAFAGGGAGALATLDAQKQRPGM